MVRDAPRRAEDLPYRGQDPPLTAEVLTESLLAQLRAPRYAGLLEQAAAADLGANRRLAVLGALRAAAAGSPDPPRLAAAAYELGVLRAKAATKHPRGAELWWTREALEQATSAEVAAHRAARYAPAGRVVDLCCSVGADLLALAASGHDVVGVDVDPLRLALARANAEVLGLAGRVALVRADVTRWVVRPGDWVFCDPARRSGSRRVFDPRRFSPSLDVVLGWGDVAAGVGVKTAPGIPHDAVPAGWQLELVSLRGDVKEAVLWSPGARTGPTRRATLLPGGYVLDATGAAPAPVSAPGRYLLEPDGAVIRAGLVAELAAVTGAWQIDPTIAFLSSDVPLTTPFGRTYTVVDVLPTTLKVLRARLRELDAGEVVVKTRGSALDPDDVRRRLATKGHRRLTVVLTRVRGRPAALVVEPSATATAR